MMNLLSMTMLSLSLSTASADAFDRCARKRNTVRKERCEARVERRQEALYANSEPFLPSYLAPDLDYLDAPDRNPFNSTDFSLRQVPFGVETLDTVLFSVNRIRAALLMSDYIAHLNAQGRTAEARQAAEVTLLVIPMLVAEIPESIEALKKIKGDLKGTLLQLSPKQLPQATRALLVAAVQLPSLAVELKKAMTQLRQHTRAARP